MSLVRTLDGKRSDKWMETLLSSEFFGECTDHRYLRKNEKNVFCMDCSVGICRHCADSHCLHRRIQICRYVYHDVLRLHDIQPYFDCSEIQTYKINGEKAIHLNSRPQAKDAKPSTKSKNGASCETCRRYIQDIPNRFCSISCKTASFSIGHGYYSPHKTESSNPEGSIEEKKSCTSSLTDVSNESENLFNHFSFRSHKRLRARKGIPHRSPLF
ncbi:PREDICTED: uncharacterized protein LOC104824121 [Tarenaya hassleriana]|uniref:uncharacterized protein LOC104824121 n=1 Tax=Tarenaya hassleriana TaxID=28532 RepID=UPI00053C7758|nr:PREDICTED: uncharacterized protein LOC104824121 [Tarenaya hassleriana]